MFQACVYSRKASKLGIYMYSCEINLGLGLCLQQKASKLRISSLKGKIGNEQI